MKKVQDILLPLRQQIILQNLRIIIFVNSPKTDVTSFQRTLMKPLNEHQVQCTCKIKGIGEVETSQNFHINHFFTQQKHKMHDKHSSESSSTDHFEKLLHVHRCNKTLARLVRENQSQISRVSRPTRLIARVTRSRSTDRELALSSRYNGLQAGFTAKRLKPDFQSL